MSGFLGSAWQLAFQSSPIVLHNGIATLMPGGYLPLISLTEGLGIAGGLLTGDLPTSQNEFFAAFEPLPGSTLISNQIATYPFANQSVAANSTVNMPLVVSMLMKAPVRNADGYREKQSKFMSLKSTLDMHIELGGTFLVVTPAATYEDCLLLNLSDVTQGESKQRQIIWQWDFQAPLVTEAQASTAYNSVLSRIDSGGMVTTSSWSGLANATNAPLQGAAPTYGGVATEGTSVGTYVNG